MNITRYYKEELDAAVTLVRTFNKSFTETHRIEEIILGMIEQCRGEEYGFCVETIGIRVTVDDVFMEDGITIAQIGIFMNTGLLTDYFNRQAVEI